MLLLYFACHTVLQLNMVNFSQMPSETD